MKFFKYFLFITFIACNLSAEIIETYSPDGNIKISFRIGDNGTAQYMLSSGSTLILNWSALGLNFKEGGLLSSNLKVISIEKNSVDQTYPIISGKSKYGRDFCNETKLTLEEKSKPFRKIELWFRAYNDGAAFRYGIPQQKELNNFTLSSEETSFSFTSDDVCWAMKKNGFKHSYEGEYKKSMLSDLKDSPANPGYLITLPLTVEINPKLYVVLSEAAIVDYAGMYLVKDANSLSFKSVLSPLPENTAIAVKGSAPMVTPWRAFFISSTAGGLIESNLLLSLNKPNALNDISWIKPGKSLWSWWANDRGFDPSFGYNIISTNTIKYHIDFAAANNIEYYTIDGGWYGWFDATKEDVVRDLTKAQPELDMNDVVSYADSKGVGIFLWVVWHHLDKQMETALDYYQSLGIKGIKVDFMDRDDQYMVDFYNRTALECAKRNILVNFHGSYKPDGTERTHPNVLTREGIMANEYAKWDAALPNPVHNVTVPFTRMVAGPMDYTPGSMSNSTKENFKPVENYPVTMGTRAQQLAMFVVYQSGLVTLCESPKLYEKLPEFELIKQVPATWDSTIVLSGKIGEYISIARKKDDIWYIGAMTDWSSREMSFPLSFLEDGEYSYTVYADGDDADTNPQNVKITNGTVSNTGSLKFRLAKGGGFGMILKKK